MKPITFALLLKANKLNPYDIINVYGGKYKIGSKEITDEHKGINTVQKMLSCIQ